MRVKLTDEAILGYIERHPGAVLEDMAAAFGLANSTTEKRCSRLRSKGRLVSALGNKHRLTIAPAGTAEKSRGDQMGTAEDAYWQHYWQQPRNVRLTLPPPTVRLPGDPGTTI